jgi:hypothetical protein
VVAAGERLAVADVQGYFASLWNLATESRPVRFGEKDTKESLLELGQRILAVLCEAVEPGTEVLAVEEAFRVPLIDPETGEVLDRDLVGSLDRLERDPEGRLVVVDLKTAARKHSDLQVDASLQLSVYSYATMMNGLGDQEDLRLRFDVLTKTKQPELHRYWTQRDRAATRRLFRLAAEVLRAIEADAFHPIAGWHTARTARFATGAGHGHDVRRGTAMKRNLARPRRRRRDTRTRGMAWPYPLVRGWARGDGGARCPDRRRASWLHRRHASLRGRPPATKSPTLG